MALIELESRNEPRHINNVSSSTLQSLSRISLRSQPMDPQDNLNEIVAPPPAYDTSKNQDLRHDYLEDRRSRGDQESLQQTGEASQNAGVSSAPESAGSIWRLSTMVYTIGYLIFFSFAGTVLRLAIECLTFYPGSPVNTCVLWANVGGSFLMGFLSEDQELFRIEDSHDRQSATKHKKTVPLFIGLTTGFCGSLTSFSTFIRDVFLALSNGLAVPLGPYSDLSLFGSVPSEASAPNGGFSFMAILAVLFTEIGLSLFGLTLGAHLAIGTSTWMPRLSQGWLRKVLDPIVLILAVLSWIVVICLAASLPKGSQKVTLWSTEMWRGPVVFALIFAPLGTLARFFASMKLNARIVSFPLGTFVINVGGTMVLGMAYSLQHASVSGASVVGCQVLQGIMDGFCGCATTVSTWVLELSTLRKKHAYFYASLSVVVALCALLLEIGSLKWTRGLVTPSCFRTS